MLSTANAGQSLSLLDVMCVNDYAPHVNLVGLSCRQAFHLAYARMVSDVLEGGRPPRPRRSIPRWVWTSIISALAGVLATIAVLGGGSHTTATPGNSPSSPPGSASPLSTPTTSTSASAASWPTSPGACGSSAYLPSGNLAQQYALKTDATILVGNRTISHVTAVPPTSASVVGLPSAGSFVSQLVAGPDADYAMVASCDGAPVGAYRITAGAAQPINVGGATALLGGVHHAWAVRDLPPGSNAKGQPICPCTELTPLDGGPTLRLDDVPYAIADVRAGLVVSHADPVNSDSAPILELVDPATGTIVRTLGTGYALGATGNTLLVQGPDCATAGLPPHCSIVSIDLTTGKFSRSYPLPADSTPVSEAVFSANGTLAAFQLARQGIDAGFKAPDPFPPSEIMILHLDTGGVDFVPNLYLAPKTIVGLAMDKTTNRIWITVDRGNTSDLLVWQPGMSGPGLVISLPGPIPTAPPILLNGASN